MAGSKVQRVPPGFTTGGGTFLPIASGAAGSLGIRPPAIKGLVELQTLGFSNDTFTVTVPTIAANGTADVPYTYNPSTLPVRFQLVRGASGLIYVDIDLPQLPQGLGIIGFSKSLTFALGSVAAPGSANWQLSPQTQYQAPSIQGSIRFFSPAGTTASTSVQFVAWSFLLCKPPTVT